jgi:PASTA domain
VLPYLDVPRDVPLNPRFMQAAYKRQDAADTSSLEDFTPTDFSGQPDELPTESNAVTPAEAKQPAPEVMMAVDEGGDVTVPDFGGKTMREVTEMCLRLGLDPVLIGTNLATEQTPAAGATVRHGAKVTVQFGTPPPKPVKAHKGSKR